MKHYLIADRYARSLSGAIKDDDALEAALEALQGISQLFADNRDLHSVIANPAIAVGKRVAILNAILDHGDTPELLKKLVATLVQRGRITLLPDVAELFGAQTDIRLNRISAKVTSAVELSEEQTKNITASLEKFSGMHVRINHTVDPEILGGIAARIGGTVIDGSVRARIERLKQSLLPEENLGG
ncbi:MAG: ATP synthase F1 subunit delta [Candidatus Hydrogenedentes bacterium]|nr:ATP synthase F1 subunit delta [Candidatus Hydrogenedentota bacterium]